MADARLRVIASNPNRPDQARAEAELFRRYPDDSPPVFSGEAVKSNSEFQPGALPMEERDHG